MRTLSALGFALLVSGCAGTSYLKDSRTLTTSVSPQVNDLIQRNDSLRARASRLPADGAAEVTAGLSHNRAELDSIKDNVTGAPAQIEGAEKKKDLQDAKRVYDEERASSERLPAAKSDLDRLESQVAALESAQRTPAAAAPTQYTKTLSTGYKVSGDPNGIEAQLVAFIEDNTRPVDKTTWFDFDRLTFKTGSANLDVDRSTAQLTNIVEILKAFPQVTLRVGGYTDNVGKPASNLKLSKERAQNVAKNLVDLGVASTRLAPEGYGQQFPKCPANDTDDCRQQNRRISVRVTAK